MERSRSRSLLGLVLLILGIVLFSHQLMHSFMPMPVEPHPPAVPPGAPYAPGADLLPGVSSDAAIQDLHALPDAPPPPAMPPLPELPPLPPIPPAPASTHQFPLHPMVIVLGIVLLALWRRREQHDIPAV